MSSNQNIGNAARNVGNSPLGPGGGGGGGDDPSGGGSTGFGLWKYTTTTGLPASGYVSFDNADPLLATTLFISDTREDGLNVSQALSTITYGASVMVKHDEENYLLVQVTSFIQPPGVHQFNIQQVTAIGALSDQDEVGIAPDRVIEAIPSSSGGSLGIGEWLLQTTGIPAIGEITRPSTGLLNIHKERNDGLYGTVDMGPALLQYRRGCVIFLKSSATKILEFVIEDVTDQGDYVQYAYSNAVFGADAPSEPYGPNPGDIVSVIGDQSGDPTPTRTIYDPDDIRQFIIPMPAEFAPDYPPGSEVYGIPDGENWGFAGNVSFTRPFYNLGTAGLVGQGVPLATGLNASGSGLPIVLIDGDNGQFFIDNLTMFGDIWMDSRNQAFTEFTDLIVACPDLGTSDETLTMTMDNIQFAIATSSLEFTNTLYDSVVVRNCRTSDNAFALVNTKVLDFTGLNSAGSNLLTITGSTVNAFTDLAGMYVVNDDATIKAGSVSDNKLVLKAPGITPEFVSGVDAKSLNTVFRANTGFFNTVRKGYLLTRNNADQTPNAGVDVPSKLVVSNATNSITNSSFEVTALSSLRLANPNVVGQDIFEGNLSVQFSVTKVGGGANEVTLFVYKKDPGGVFAPLTDGTAVATSGPLTVESNDEVSGVILAPVVAENDTEFELWGSVNSNNDNIVLISQTMEIS